MTQITWYLPTRYIFENGFGQHQFAFLKAIAAGFGTPSFDTAGLSLYDLPVCKAAWDIYQKDFSDPASGIQPYHPFTQFYEEIEDES